MLHENDRHGIDDGSRSRPCRCGYRHLYYFIEERAEFLPLIEPLFREVDQGRRELITFALTLLEVLVVPYRNGKPSAGRAI
jgi:hypothetical protein